MTEIIHGTNIYNRHFMITQFNIISDLMFVKADICHTKQQAHELYCDVDKYLGPN